MDNFVDYYELLHVQQTAPAAVIKASYRTMMQKLKNHPDYGGDVSFAQQLNRAIKVLSDPQSREQYDKDLASHLARKHSHAEPLMSKHDFAAHRQTQWGEPGGSPNSSSSREQTRNSGLAQPGTTSAYHQRASAAPDTRGISALSIGSRCPFCYAHRTAAKTSDGHSYRDSHRCSTCNGATTAVKPVALAGDDPLCRIHRQAHKTDAKVWLSWPSTAIQASQLTDFSPTGCALRLMEPVAEGECIMIETGLFNAICRLCHCNRPANHASYVIGVEFITLDIMSLRGSLLDATA